MSRDVALSRISLISIAICASLEGRALAVPTRTVIVFDDSGSMRQNDPGRLSVAAAKLYVELARPGDEVALISFGDAAKALVPLGRPADRGAIAKALESVRFNQKVTNIGAGLESATQALGHETPAGRKDLVLLITDGKLDLGASRASELGAEQARIAGPLVEALRERGTPVYTIAFTEHADRALLEKIAAKSGGSYRYIADAGTLHKAFTEMFMLAGDVESLPIEGGKLTIDESIGSASLVLSKHGPKDVNTLTAPDEAVVSATSHTPGVQWTSAPSHDVVRFEKPQAGPWGIHQPPGAEGAVAIVEESDLAFVVRVGPSPSTVDDEVLFEAELLEHEQRIVAFTRLKEVVIKAQIKDPEGHVREVKLETAKDKPGLFGAKVENHTPGEHAVVFTATSPSLMRERRTTYRVVPSCFSASVDEQQGLTLRVKGGEGCPRYSAIAAKAMKKVDNHGPETLAVVPNAHGGFDAVVPPLAAGEKGDVVVELVGRTSDGYPVHYELPPLPLPTTVKKSFADKLKQGLVYADGPIFFVVALVFVALWKRKKPTPMSAPVKEHDEEPRHVEAAPPAPPPPAEPKLVLLAAEDLDAIDPPKPEQPAAASPEVMAAKAAVVKLAELSKVFNESLETLLLKQAEVATQLGGLGGPDGLPPAIKERADLVTAGMRSMDDLLMQASDRSVELDIGLRALEDQVGGLANAKGPPPARPNIDRINLVLVEKAGGQTPEELAKAREKALASQSSGESTAELSKTVEALTEERQLLAAEKAEITNKLNQVTDEYNKLFAETHKGDAPPG
jgi:hypothetical protein